MTKYSKQRLYDLVKLLNHLGFLISKGSNNKYYTKLKINKIIYIKPIAKHPAYMFFKMLFKQRIERRVSSAWLTMSNDLRSPREAWTAEGELKIQCFLLECDKCVLKKPLFLQNCTLKIIELVEEKS